LINASDSTIWVSAVCVWEISIKAALRRAGAERTFYDVLSHELDLQGFHQLPITFQHALAVRNLPLHHGDPFDRMLIAQAQHENLTLLTADPRIGLYGARTLDACI
jgi:PIN domain nuclease of toxin-antitoxin system